MAEYLLLDLETAPLPEAEQWVRVPKASGTLKDPIKIAADIAEKQAALRDKMALDWNTNQIVAFGMWSAVDDEPIVLTQAHTTEVELLECFKAEWKQHKKMIVFRGRQFDCPTIIQRCRAAVLWRWIARVESFTRIIGSSCCAGP